MFCLHKGEATDWINPLDAAVDLEASDIEAYMETLDKKHLVIKDGMEPEHWEICGMDGYEHGKVLDRSRRKRTDEDPIPEHGKVTPMVRDDVRFVFEILRYGLIKGPHLDPAARVMDGGVLCYPAAAVRIYDYGTARSLSDAIWSLSQLSELQKK